MHLLSKIKNAIIHFLRNYLRSSKWNSSSNRVSSPIPTNNQTPLPKELQFVLNNMIPLYDGKLLLRHEINLDESTFQQYVQHRLFQPIQPIIPHLFSFKCMRCNNRNKSLFAYFPCEKCNEQHVYCRHCIHMGKISTCEPLYYWSGKQMQWPKIDGACTWQGTLTTSQQKAANKIVDTIINKGKLLTWAVTGSGKTEMLFKGIEFALKKGERICIASPRADVIRELLPRLKAAFAAIHVQGLYSDSKDNDGSAQLILATTHQLLRFRNAFDLLIIDEIDSFPYHYDASLQYATSQAVKQLHAKIYLTATPRRKQKMRMFMRQLPYMFVPIRFHEQPLIIPKLQLDFTSKSRLNRNKLPKTFIQWIKSRTIKTRQILIFTPTVRLAEEIKRVTIDLLLTTKDVQHPREVATVHAGDRLREAKIELFRKRKLKVLITTTILERGVTFPSIDVVVMLACHEVFDEQALIQIAGRAGRSKKDPVGEVVFIYEQLTNAIIRAKNEMITMNKRAKQHIKNEKRVADE